MVGLPARVDVTCSGVNVAIIVVSVIDFVDIACIMAIANHPQEIHGQKCLPSHDCTGSCCCGAWLDGSSQQTDHGPWLLHKRGPGGHQMMFPALWP